MRISVGVEFDIEDQGRVAGRLEYASDDPWAVKLAFGLGEQYDWSFARELFDGPMCRTVGVGDVLVTMCDQYAHIQLCSPEGNAMLRTRQADVVAFLESTYRCVPRGTEGNHVDFDPALWLDGAA